MNSLIQDLLFGRYDSQQNKKVHRAINIVLCVFAGILAAVVAVIISGLTNASGIISDSRTYTSSQPFTGAARRGTSSPVYKSQPITGTISNTTGVDASVVMTPD